MLYLSPKWNDLEAEELSGSLQVASQGRLNQPVILALAVDLKNKTYNMEVAVILGINLSSLAEDEDQLNKAETEQDAVNLINSENDPAAYDLVDSLAKTGRIGGRTRTLVSNKFPLTVKVEVIKEWLQTKALWYVNSGGAA